MSNLEMPKYQVEEIDLDGDIGSPLSIYQHVRNIFPESLLLECLEYKDTDKTRSFICADPIFSFRVTAGVATVEQAGAEPQRVSVSDIVKQFQDFIDSIEIDQADYPDAGLFGFTGYDSIPHFEDIEFRSKPNAGGPEFYYALYRFVFIFDHTTHKARLIHLVPDGGVSADARSAQQLVEEVSFRRPTRFRFSTDGEEACSLTDSQFLAAVARAKQHITRGDVFQLVVSRQFSQAYLGDEFEVYRALRRINPSPFLFFFDYGSFSLFGSSPEAQLIVKDGKAKMFPIAGTYRRGTSAQEDAMLAQRLMEDPKENAEHVMLVDLARNDLGRSCERVNVLRFRETELYSHVIHLVSVVESELKVGTPAIQVLADTFPAGTLSGAPKFRAMQLIDELEPVSRNLYGGCVGFISLKGACTQAIIIRSFLARNRTLMFQAGAGIVDSSVPESELNEITNKLAALRRAIEAADSKVSVDEGVADA